MLYGIAATRPVNPPGVEPVITEEQLWKGIEYKLRHPSVRAFMIHVHRTLLTSPFQAFAPMISSCKVTIDIGNKVRGRVKS